MDKRVILIGEGVPDPKAVFGTTTRLKEKFPKQVFDSPVSENGVTGICIGAAINGLRPILVHQRMDFSLYSADQIINVASKWYSMYGGQKSVPLVIRMIVGRGWGQGNQHSQNLTSLYALVPGLKIVCPSNAYDAKGLLISAVYDDNPVIFVEHRWLHETTSHVPEGYYECELEPVGLMPDSGFQITIVSSGHATLETKKALELLKFTAVHHIDLNVIKPLNIDLIKHSVNRSGRLLVVDDCWGFGGVAAEIIASVAESCDLKAKPARITYPNFPSASSTYLTKNYYPGPYDIANKIFEVSQSNYEIDFKPILDYQLNRTHDVPDQNFRGPF
jgi:pyruvate dehydrogenase E1 component beta subunit